MTFLWAINGLKIMLRLLSQTSNVLKSSVMPPVPVCPTGFVSQEMLSLSFEQQKELLCLLMQSEMEKEVTIEKLRQRTELTKLELETEKLK